MIVGLLSANTDDFLSDGTDSAQELVGTLALTKPSNSRMASRDERGDNLLMSDNPENQ